MRPRLPRLPKGGGSFRFTVCKTTTAKKPARSYVQGLAENGKWKLLAEISEFAAGDQHQKLIACIAAKVQDGHGGLTRSQCRDLKFELLLKLRGPALG